SGENAGNRKGVPPRSKRVTLRPAGSVVARPSWSMTTRRGPWGRSAGRGQPKTTTKAPIPAATPIASNAAPPPDRRLGASVGAGTAAASVGSGGSIVTVQWYARSLLSDPLSWFGA